MDRSLHGGSAEDPPHEPDALMGIWGDEGLSEGRRERRSTREDASGRATRERPAKGASRGAATEAGQSSEVGGDGQDLRRHQELRELERYSRSVQEENYEELRRQHVRAERQVILPRGLGDSSDTRGTPTIYTTPTEEASPPADEDMQGHELPDVAEGLALGDPASDATDEDIAGPTFFRQLTHTIKDNHLLLENQIYQQRQLTEIYRRFQNSKRLDDVTFSVGSTSSSTRQFSEH